ncbi:MAG: 50S ribosomal protein L10 [Patescibacteria group bacterium]
MAKTKEQKQEALKNLKEKIADQKAIVFVDYKGLKVQDLLDLRETLRENNSQFLIEKKTLIKLALKDNEMETNTDEMEGQIGLIFGYDDELSPAKTAYNFSKKNNNMKILGGYIESQKNEFLNPAMIVQLGQLPSRKELLSKLVGSISSPIVSFNNVLQGNIKGLLQVLSTIKK